MSTKYTNRVKMGNKIKQIWNLLMSMFNFGKKRSEKTINDAVRLPEAIEKHILEDYEIAAYHNQA